MSDPLQEDDDAATPLTEEERKGLIPTYITLKQELNEAEQRNIMEAERMALSRRLDVLDEKPLLALHKRMFGDVWEWAGQFRRSARNIGVDPSRIAENLRQLLDDTKYWIANGVYPIDEIATRFHHKLVWIHCFPNGNGRHARLATDLLLIKLGQPRFTWGRVNLVDASDTRRHYVDALRAADNHNIQPLLNFVRT